MLKFCPFLMYLSLTGKSYVASPSAGPAQVKVEEGQAATDPAAVRGPSPATVTTVPVTALSGGL